MSISLPNSSKWILASLILGLALGAGLSITSPSLAERFAALLAPIGTLWVNGIRMTVIPLLMALLVTAITDSTDSQSNSGLGIKTVLLFIGLIVYSTVCTFLFAPPLISLIQIDPSAASSLLASVGGDSTATDLPPFSDWLVALVPSNAIAAAANGSVLPLLVFTALFASALSKVESEHRGTVVSFFIGLRDAMQILIAWIMRLAPLGIFGLVFPLAATLGFDAVRALAAFIFLSSMLILVLALSLYLVVHFFTQVPIREFARRALPAQIIGFSTRSSLAALPATFAAVKQLGATSHVSGLVLPAAVTLLKFASPIARTSGTYFVAILYGIDLSTYELFLIAAAIGVFSFYSPGIPSGGLLIMAPVYLSLGLPVEGIGILIAIDLVVDMFLTAANVTANIASTLLLSR
jgi:Na+/H+-dicarboxylate symporter